jgi:hypothetical protein
MTTKKRTVNKLEEAVESCQITDKCRRLMDAIQTRAEEVRQNAAFHALEALESENQDAAEQRQNAIRLAGIATGYLAAIELIRTHM